MNDNNEKFPVWPPAIVSEDTPDCYKTEVTKTSPIALEGKFFLGFLCGIILSIFCGVGLFLIFVKIGGAEMLYTVTSQNRMITFYTERVIQIANLGTPCFIYLWLRKRHPSLSLGLFIGGSVINLVFLLWYFFGL